MIAHLVVKLFLSHSWMLAEFIDGEGGQEKKATMLPAQSLYRG